MSRGYRVRDRIRQLARTPHPFAPTGRMYDGAPLCAYCNTTEAEAPHTPAAIALARLRRDSAATTTH